MVEIDSQSGFCFGVTRAIQRAEEELQNGNLYCLGDIVHNGEEVSRLSEMGLITIDHEQMSRLHDVKVLLRAHGEPPTTYALAERNGIRLFDASCPVVLGLQKRIRTAYQQNPDAQIVI
ncbi:MAG: 4-hydroxy-3-methylbut-2-enyl diphosphate reductase, partial [Bacteroidales bacterium]|nr:4-hydroxy-3-methylbut-2-enyl diphosphate reductase [Candidatus Colicola faecequi]